MSLISSHLCVLCLSCFQGVGLITHYYLIEGLINAIIVTLNWLCRHQSIESGRLRYLSFLRSALGKHLSIVLVMINRTSLLALKRTILLLLQLLNDIRLL